MCTSGEEHIVVSYSRATFLQTGDGHYSPIGGYHAGADEVLILDVVGARLARALARWLGRGPWLIPWLRGWLHALLRKTQAAGHTWPPECGASRCRRCRRAAPPRPDHRRPPALSRARPHPPALQARFKYPPHWVPLEMLFDAMRHTDAVTGQPRGYMRMSAHNMLDSLLFSLDIKTDGWQGTERFVRHQAAAFAQVGAARGLRRGAARGGSAAGCRPGCSAPLG